MLDGFRRFDTATSDHQVKIHGVVGGAGPPVLLLHGNPLTHIHWRLVAPRLAEEFTVVATDLRGYGDSGKPRGLPDHSNYSFRRMAQDQVEVMEHLGFREFYVAGHDRGARVGFRMALDHPGRVRKFASIDIIPTHWQLTRMKWSYAAHSYHWFFLAQPYDFPEQLLRGNEEYYMRKKFAKQGEGKISDETMKEYLRCCTPEQIHGVCSDYRATLAVDFPMDTADFEAGRKIQCPALILWAEKSHTHREFDAREAWPHYCANIYKFRMLPCAHYPIEEAPDRLYQELDEFFKR